MNKLLCSSGVMVGRVNKYDYSLVGKYFPDLVENKYIDGAEFMMIPFYYDKLSQVIDDFISYGINYDVMHFDKEIGDMLSKCDDTLAKDAIELFKKNCEIACKLGSERVVFHLWGGCDSDSHVDYNISKLPKLIEISNSFKLKLLIENIPCTTYSGLENWRKIYNLLPQIEFIFDTRFGAFHDETEDVLKEPIWDYINHIHISDYSSFPRDFSKIHPILHPGEGVVDFEKFFDALKSKNYTGSITLESPVMCESGANIEKLKKSLLYIKNIIK